MPDISRSESSLGLPGRVELACRFLSRAFDADRPDTPFFYIRTNARGRCYLDHVFWYDTCHVPGRCLDAMLNARHVFGIDTDEVAVERFARVQKRALRGYEGFGGYLHPTSGAKCIGFHNLRESLFGLLALMRFTGDPAAARMARRLLTAVAGLFDVNGEVRPKALARLGRRCTCKSLGSTVCYTTGRFIGALVKYYRHTRDPVALELARRFADLALAHAFQPDGRLAERAGKHVHSITATVNGIVDLGRLLGDERYILGARRAYDAGLQGLRSSFGWFTESKDRRDNLGEANSTADAIQAAVLLGQCGYPEYFEDAECMLYGHLLPSQLLDVSSFLFHPRPRRDANRVTPERLRGGWGLASINEQVLNGWRYIATYDNTAGPVQGLCQVWQASVTADATGVRVNLLLDHDSELARVDSGLPETGRISVEVRVSRPLYVRLPSWQDPAKIKVTVDGRRTKPAVTAGYLRICGQRAGRQVVLRFPRPKHRETSERINGKRYRIRWRGSHVVAFSPAGKRCPMFPAITRV